MDKNLNDCKKFLLFYSLKKSNIFIEKKRLFPLLYYLRRIWEFEPFFRNFAHLFFNI